VIIRRVYSGGIVGLKIPPSAILRLVRHANAAPGNGATVYNGFVCGLGPSGTTTASHAVITPSGQENEQCHGANSMAAPSNGATQFKGFPCTLHTDGTTTDSMR
jgi:hypothetical protein